MKRLNKKNIFSKEELEQLNELEQKSLLGGSYGDINNNNSSLACNCDYNNHSAITNNNSFEWCTCTCI